MKISRLLLLLFSLGSFVACKSTPPAGSANAETASTPPSPSDKSGTQLWSENCIRCHNNRSPASYSDSQWAAAMMHMRVRANLTVEEHKKILEFLQSAN